MGEQSLRIWPEQLKGACIRPRHPPSEARDMAEGSRVVS